MKVAEDIYKKLQDLNVEVVLDDRDERPGFKFKDWELIGIPFMVIVGRNAADGICEFKVRSTMEKTEKHYSEIIEEINKQVKNIK